MTGRTVSPWVTTNVFSSYGLVPAAALSPLVCEYNAGLGFGLGVGPGEVIVQNDGGAGVQEGGGVGVVGVVYASGQRLPTIPADADAIGGLVIFNTPIWLLKRMLLGSALANIGASASVAVAHGVAVAESEELRRVGMVPESFP